MIYGANAKPTSNRNMVKYSAVNLNKGYLKLPSGYFINGDFAISAWVKINKYSSQQRIVDIANGANVNSIILSTCDDIGCTPYIALSPNPGSHFTSYKKLAIGEWAFISASATANQVFLYLNGSEVARGTISPPRRVLRTSSYVGRSNWNFDSDSFLDIHDLKIFNRSLSQNEMIYEMDK